MIPALEAPGRHRDFRVLALSLRLTVAVARPAEPGNDAASEVTVTTHRRFTTVAVGLNGELGYLSKWPGRPWPRIQPETESAAAAALASGGRGPPRPPGPAAATRARRGRSGNGLAAAQTVGMVRHSSSA